MNKDKYLIGDVAGLMGMSRDTLRHYEKRGLVTARKADNGYRYYTESDLSKLVGILYQRKMDIGLSDIASLWNEQSSVDTVELYDEIITQRLEDEKEAIRQHECTIARLKMSQKDCSNIRKYHGKIIECSLPDSYIIHPDLDFRHGIEQWFEYAREDTGLDVMYLFDAYKILPFSENSCVKMDFLHSMLFLHKDMAEYTDYPITQDLVCTDQTIRYLSTFCTSPDRIPPSKAIQTLLNYAKQHQLSTQDQLLSTFLTQGVRDQKSCYYLQLFLPISGSADDQKS